MTPWLWTAAALMLGLIACGGVIAGADAPDRLVALQMAGTLAALILLLLARAFGQPSFGDLALALALLALPAALQFAHFLERWL